MSFRIDDLMIAIAPPEAKGKGPKPTRCPPHPPCGRCTNCTNTGGDCGVCTRCTECTPTAPPSPCGPGSIGKCETTGLSGQRAAELERLRAQLREVLARGERCA